MIRRPETSMKLRPRDRRNFHVYGTPGIIGAASMRLRSRDRRNVCARTGTQEAPRGFNEAAVTSMCSQAVHFGFNEAAVARPQK